MLLKNLAIASAIEAKTFSNVRTLKMYIGPSQIALLRRQLIALDSLDSHGVTRITQAQRAALNNHPESLMSVTEDAPDPTKEAKKNESTSDIFGAFSDPKPAPSGKKNETVPGQEVKKPVKQVKDDRVRVPSKSMLIDKSDLMSVIVAGMKTSGKSWTPDHVRARIIGYLSDGPVHDDNETVITRIAEIYAKESVLW